MPDKSFGDISHDRDSRSLNLSTKTKVLLPSLVQAYRFVDLPRQLSGFFPTIEVLKSRELHISENIVGLVCPVYSVHLVSLVEEICYVFPVN